MVQHCHPGPVRGCDITEEAISMAQEVLTSKRTTEGAEPTEQPLQDQGTTRRTRQAVKESLKQARRVQAFPFQQHHP